MRVLRRRWLIWLFLVGLPALVLIACGDVFKEINGLEELVEEKKDEADEFSPLSDDNDDNILTGVLYDGVVDGVYYKTSTQSGFTNSKGEYHYQPGETVQFSFNRLNAEAFGSTTAAVTTTVLDFFNTTEITDRRVVNLLRLLLTLDNDGNLNNGIQLTASLRAALLGKSFSFDQDTTAFETQYDAELQTITAVRSAGSQSIVSASTAITHFTETLSSLSSVGSSVTVTKNAPTNISLSASSVSTVSAGGTIVTLSVTDADSGDSHTFALVSGDGDTYNSSVEIGTSTGKITAKSDLPAGTYSIRVQVTDLTGETYAKALTITVSATNTPTDISLSATIVAENQSSGTTVGTLSTTDADIGDTHTYSLVSGTGSTDNSSFSISGSSLLTAAIFDFETTSSYNIRIRTTDAGGSYYEEAFTITVTNANETPTDIALTASSVTENNSSGSTVGTLSTTDADASDTHTYSLVSGTGDTNNASFSISGSSLLTAASFDYETQTSYSIRIRTTDSSSATYEESFTISINDTAPTSTLTTKVTASDGAANHYFGRSVSISGDYAIVSGGEGSTPNYPEKAYIFLRSSGSWSQQAILTASDSGGVDRFGQGSAISGDYAIVGAPYNDGVAADAGAAYIYVRSGTSWSQQAKLTASDGAASDYFGDAVAISGDYAIIGAKGDDISANNDQGSAYIFVRSGTSWSQQAKLTASDGAASDAFGQNGAVSIDGSYAIIGALQHDTDGNSNQGAAYVFIRSDTSWSQQAKLTASDGTVSDQFGRSASINGDYTIVGSYLDDDNGSASGSAYVFIRSGTSWSQQAKLTASDGATTHRFGKSVSIGGIYAIVGAYDQGATTSGAAYLFTRSGTSWSQQVKLTPSDGAANDKFGYSVSTDGDYSVVGARDDDISATTDQGSAYFY